MCGTNQISVGFRKGRYKKAIALIKDLKPKKILDIGCGRGYFLSILSKKFPDAKIYGCDINTEGVSEARKNCPRAEVSCGNFSKLEFEPVGLVVALEVMEHLENPKKMLEKAAALAGKGGHILISIPKSELLIWRAIWWVWTHTLGKSEAGEHTDLTEKELIMISRKAGLKLKKKTGFFMGCISTMLFEVEGAAAVV